MGFGARLAVTARERLVAASLPLPPVFCPRLSDRLAIRGSKPRQGRHRRAALCDLSGSLDTRRSFSRSMGTDARVEIPVLPLGIDALSLRGGRNESSDDRRR